MSNKVSKFVSLVLAQLTGDSNQVISLKNEKKAKSAINGQISALERSIEEQNDRIEDAETAFSNAFAPATALPDAQSYINNVVRAQNTLESEQKKLETLNKSLAFFQSLLKEFEPGTTEAPEAKTV